VPIDTAERVFLDALHWLGAHYGERAFYVERDIVYTVQSKLNDLVVERGLPLTVYNDFPMLAGQRRHLSADLCLVERNGLVAVAAEFKYEPCHQRLDVLKTKLPVTVWAEILKDTARVRDFVEATKTPVGYAICIDEGNYLARRDLSIYDQQLSWAAAPRHTHPVTALDHRNPPLVDPQRTSN